MRRTATTGDLYFVTLTIIKWIDVFTRKDYRDYIADNIIRCQLHKGLDLYKYVIMSNHIHLIAAINNGKTMSDFLRDFKSFTSKGIYRLIKNEVNESRKTWIVSMIEKAGATNPDNENIQVWQKGSYPVLLDNNSMIDQKAGYIEDNPVRAGIVEYPEHYIYSSACRISPLKCLEL